MASLECFFYRQHVSALPRAQYEALVTQLSNAQQRIKTLQAELGRKGEALRAAELEIQRLTRKLTPDTEALHV